VHDDDICLAVFTGIGNFLPKTNLEQQPYLLYFSWPFAYLLISDNTSRGLTTGYLRRYLLDAWGNAYDIALMATYTNSMQFFV